MEEFQQDEKVYFGASPVDGFKRQMGKFTPGVRVFDINVKTNPKLLAHRNTDPPFGGMTHCAPPLPDRKLLVLADEATGTDQPKYIWVYDVREPTNPVSIATMPQPKEADYFAKGGKFGSHNLHENRPGSFQSSRLVFATYYKAGVRAYDITDPFRPEEMGYFVPPNPEKMMDPRPGMPQVIQNADCYVDKDGFMYVTDPNAGLYILHYDGELY